MRNISLKITFKLFASLTEFLPDDVENNIAEIIANPEDSVHDLIDRFRVPRESVHLILVNGIYIVPADRDKPILKEGDVLAMWPPVAGG